VHDGYVLTKSVTRSPVGGRLLNTCLANALKGRKIDVRPRQSFRRREKKDAPGEFVVRRARLVCARAGVRALASTLPSNSTHSPAP
jgi:hypothetical protein